MAVHSWMHDDTTPRSHPHLRARIQSRAKSRVNLQALLAYSLLAAWIWLAYEIIRIVTR